MSSGALRVERVGGAFDGVRNPVQNIYIKKVEKKKMFGYDKDELWNTVIKTYPDVSQFWTYGKEVFLKQPVYSRDFPPCKYWNQRGFKLIETGKDRCEKAVFSSA